MEGKSQEKKGDARERKVKYRGVRLRSEGRWVAEIKDTTQNIRIWLGTFDSPIAAALAYDKAARLLRGENTRTNFRYDDPLVENFSRTIEEKLPESLSHIVNHELLSDNNTSPPCLTQSSIGLASQLNEFTASELPVFDLTPFIQGKMDSRIIYSNNGSSVVLQESSHHPPMANELGMNIPTKTLENLPQNNAIPSFHSLAEGHPDLPQFSSQVFDHNSLPSIPVRLSTSMASTSQGNIPQSLENLESPTLIRERRAFLATLKVDNPPKLQGNEVVLNPDSDANFSINNELFREDSPPAVGGNYFIQNEEGIGTSSSSFYDPAINEGGFQFHQTPTGDMSNVQIISDSHEAEEENNNLFSTNPCEHPFFSGISAIAEFTRDRLHPLANSCCTFNSTQRKENVKWNEEPQNPLSTLANFPCNFMAGLFRHGNEQQEQKIERHDISIGENTESSHQFFENLQESAIPADGVEINDFTLDSMVESETVFEGVSYDLSENEMIAHKIDQFHPPTEFEANVETEEEDVTNLFLRSPSSEGNEGRDEMDGYCTRSSSDHLERVLPELSEEMVRDIERRQRQPVFYPPPQFQAQDVPNFDQNLKENTLNNEDLERSCQVRMQSEQELNLENNKTSGIQVIEESVMKDSGEDVGLNSKIFTLQASMDSDDLLSFWDSPTQKLNDIPDADFSFEMDRQ